MAWVEVFGAHKQIMDIHFSQHPKIEREYQQAVVRDNNRHGTGARSDYFIVDVEYAQSSRAFGRKADLFRHGGLPLAPCSRAAPRGRVIPVIMEMKAGDARSPALRAAR